MKTTKIFNILSALLGVMTILTSCHREDLPYNDIPAESGTPISFSAINASLDTKVDGTESTNPPIETFKVWASRTNASQTVYNVFNVTGQDITYSSAKSIWTYSPVRYWQEGTYDFIAVAQAPALTGELKSTGLELTFTGGWNLNENKKDLILATALDEEDRLNATPVDPVDLVFDHQLALINFSAKNNDSKEVTFVITGVTISGNHKVASGMKFDPSSSTPATWSYSGVTTELQTLSVKNANGLSLTKEEYTVLTDDVMVFPESCDLEVTVTFVETINSVARTSTKSATIASTGWQAGKKYGYCINLTSDRLLFAEPIVTDWVDGDLVGNEMPF